MATDFLMLGGIEFRDFSPPDKMPFGGKHALAVHKLPGGQRVIDTLGPDDTDIAWKGHFFEEGAWEKCLMFDALRRSGMELPLMYGGQFFLVVIVEFTANIVRFPQYVEYSITCVVSESFGGGVGGLISSIDAMVGSDLSAAMSA